MVEVEFSSRELAATVLARVLISGKHVEAAEADMPFRNPVIGHQQDHSRHPNSTSGQADGIVMQRSRERTPTLIVESPVLLINDLGKALIDQGEGPADGGDVDREIGPIEYEHLCIQHAHLSQIPTRAGFFWLQYRHVEAMSRLTAISFQPSAFSKKGLRIAC